MSAVPIDMILFCPRCGVQHIDAPEDKCVKCRHRTHAAGRCLNMESDNGCTCKHDSKPWTNPPHRSHLCSDCGHIWRPADVATNGVAKIQTHGLTDSDSPQFSVQALTTGSAQ